MCEKLEIIDYHNKDIPGLRKTIIDRQQNIQGIIISNTEDQSPQINDDCKNIVHDKINSVIGNLNENSDDDDDDDDDNLKPLNQKIKSKKSKVVESKDVENILHNITYDDSDDSDDDDELIDESE